jgi:fructose-1,6-bisphosphatase/inositol monophosphatase family enzyme
VTSIDLSVEKYFHQIILKYYPSHSIVGEEFGENSTVSEFQWIIDPIDGTSELINNIPVYGTIISLHYKNKPIVSIIHYPKLNIRYWAAYGCGSFCNGQKISLTSNQKLFTDEGPRLSLARKYNFLRYGDEGHIFDLITKHYPNMRIYHSCYAHTCAVSGQVDAMVEWNVRLWDIAATQLLTEEAGGTFHFIKNYYQEGIGTVFSAVFGKSNIVADIYNLLRSGH